MGHILRRWPVRDDIERGERARRWADSSALHSSLLESWQLFSRANLPRANETKVTFDANGHPPGWHSLRDRGLMDRAVALQQHRSEIALLVETVTSEAERVPPKLRRKSK